MRRALFFAAAFLALLGVALLAALRSGFVHDVVREGLAGVLSEELGRPVSIGRLEGPLLPGLVLRDLRVGPAEAPTLRIPIVEIRQIELQLFPLLRVNLGSVRLEGPDGTWSSVSAEAPAESVLEPPPPRGVSFIEVALRRLEIEEGRVELRTAQGSLAARVDGWFGEMALDRFPESMVQSSGSLVLELDQPRSGRASFRAGTVQASLSRGSAALEVDLRGPGGALSGDARWAVAAWLDGNPAASFDGAFRVAEIDAGSLTGNEALSSQITAEGTIIASNPGPLGWPTAGALDAKLAFARGPLGRFHDGVVRVRLANGVWALDPVRLVGEELSLVAQGEIAERALRDLHVDLRLPDLEPWSELVGAPLAGSLLAAGRLSGPFDALAGDLAITGRGLQVRDLLLGDLDARAHAEGVEGVRITSLDLRGPQPARVEPGARLRVAGGRIDIDAFELLVAGGRIRVSGPVERAGFVELRTKIEAIELGALGVGEAGRLDGDLTWNGPFVAPQCEGVVEGTALVEAADLLLLECKLAKSGRQRVLAEYRVGLDSRFRGEVLLATTALDQLSSAAGLAGTDFAAEFAAFELSTLGSYLPTQLTEPRGRLSGAAEGRIAVGGLPEAAGVLEFRDVAGKLEAVDLELRDATGHLELDEARLRLAPVVVRVAIRGQEARATLRGALSSSGVVEPIAIELAPFDAGLLAPFTPSSPRLSGRISGELALTGRFGDPSLRGRLDWRDPRVAERDLDRVEARVEATRGGALATVELAQPDGGSLRLHGTVPFAWAERSRWPSASIQHGRLTISADHFDPGFLASLSPSVVRGLGGRVTGEIEVARRTIEGGLSIRDGSLELKGHQERYSVDGQLDFAPGRVQVRALRLAADGGRALLQGRLEHRELRFEAAALRLTLDGLPVSRRNRFRTELTGALDLAGSLGRPVLRGRVALGGLDVVLPKVLGSEGGDDDIEVVGEEPSALTTALRSGGVLDAASASVVVDVPPGSQVRGHDVKGVITGALQVSKAPQSSPTIGGELVAERGSYDLHGRRFEIRRGRLRFDGRPVIDPIVDVEARHPIRDIVVVASLSGPISDPIVSLSSEPVLSNEDILSYLLLGRPAGQLSAGRRELVSGAAASLATGLASSELGAITSRWLNVDEIDVAARDDGTATVYVGETLTDRLWVRAGKEIGIDGAEVVEFEFKLTPHFSVQSEITSEGHAGGDLIWRLDY